MVRRSILLLVACVSCAPGLQSGREAARGASDSFVKAVSERDVVAIQTHFGPSLAYGGLYFASTGCMQKFPVPTLIEVERQADFAGCLATLLLARSERSDELFNVAVYEYAPGIEIEAKFDELDGVSKLTWIGYSGRRGIMDGLPTIAPSMLESVRVEGDPKAPLSTDNATKLAAEHSLPGDHAWAWLKVCLDAGGAVTGVHPREASTPFAARVFTEVAQTWKFKPVVLGGTSPVPVCSLVRLSHPPMESPEILPVAFEVPEKAIRVPIVGLAMIEGEKNVTPNDDDKGKLMRYAPVRVVGSFMFCIDDAGKVDKVGVLDPTGLPRYDARIQQTIATWKYRPYVLDGKPVRVCSAVTFVYSQR